MEQVKLERKDWENAKRHAKVEIKNALASLEINNNLLRMAEAKISEFPEEDQAKELTK